MRAMGPPAPAPPGGRLWQQADSAVPGGSAGGGARLSAGAPRADDASPRADYGSGYASARVSGAALASSSHPYSFHDDVDGLRGGSSYPDASGSGSGSGKGLFKGMLKKGAALGRQALKAAQAGLHSLEKSLEKMEPVEARHALVRGRVHPPCCFPYDCITVCVHWTCS